MTPPFPPIRWRNVLQAFAVGAGLLLALASAPAVAQRTDDAALPDFDAADWTGQRQSPAQARKEAGAALVEGRRACARERDRNTRTACVRQVEADHAAMLKRIARRTAPTGK